MTEEAEEVSVDLSEFQEGHEEQEVEQQAPEYSDVELKAMEMGWNPEGVEGKRNLSAEEFVDRKELYDSIHSLKKQNKRLEEGYDALRKHYEHVESRTREKVLEELKAKKRTALEEEDYDAVIKIDEQILEESSRPNTVADAPKTNPAFEDWVEKNSWYNDDTDMRQYADMIGPGMLQRNPGWSQEQFFNAITAEVKARYRDKFENPNRGKASPVEGASRSSGKSKSKYSEKDLPDDARAIMKTLVRNGDVTKEKFLEEYFG